MLIIKQRGCVDVISVLTMNSVDRNIQYFTSDLLCLQLQFDDNIYMLYHGKFKV